MTTPSFDPAAYLLAQLNLINPDALLPLSASNVTITNPLATDESAAMDSVAPVINTTATLVATDGQGFEGKSQFYYQRVSPTAYLTSLGHPSGLTVSLDGVTDWPSFFDAFNTAYNTVFTAVDYPTTPFVVPEEGALTVTLAAGSLLFVGSMSVTLTGAVPTPSPVPSPTPPTPTPTPPTPTPTPPTPTPTPPTPTPTPSPSLPDANDGWVNFEAGVIRFTVGHLTVAVGDATANVDGVLAPHDWDQLSQEGSISGTNGTIDGGMPVGYDLTLMAISFAGNSSSQVLVYDTSGNSVATYNPTIVSLIDAEGTVYYQGQLGTMNTLGLSQSIGAATELALVFTAWGEDYGASPSDFLTEKGAIQFVAQDFISSSINSGFRGLCATGGYTSYFGSIPSNTELLNTPPTAAVIDAILFQIPGSSGGTPPQRVIVNFVTAANESENSVISNVFSSRTGRIVDSAGTVYWSGTVGDLQQIAVDDGNGHLTIATPVELTNDNAYTTGLLPTGSYALVLDPVVTADLASAVQVTELSGLAPPVPLSSLITNTVVSSGLTLSQLNGG